jgi:hypothetical protein
MIPEAGAPGPGECQGADVKTPSNRRIEIRNAYDELSNGMQIAILTLVVAVAPLAFPAWGVEWIIRRWRRNFEFEAFNSTPYFLFVAAVAAAGIIATDAGVIQIIALYILALMELISLSVCVTIAVVSPGRLQTLNHMVARRSYKPRVITASRSTVYMAVVSACYAIFFFGTLSYAIWRADPSYFGDVSEPSTRMYSFWQFIQNSFLTMTNAGTTLVSRRFLSQLIGDFERIVGLFFLVFLLAVLASGWAERALKRVNMSAEPESNSEEEV